MPLTNEEALHKLIHDPDVKMLSVSATDTIVVTAEGMGGADWLCFRIPEDVDLPELGTTLIRAYDEALT